jgi:hypothetical protein
MRKVTIPVWVIALVAVALISAACGAIATGGLNKADNRKDDVEHRNDAYNAAKAKYPDPHPVNFPMRKQLVEFTNREDQLNHPWYVYILGDNGNTIGYYVAKFAPENSCNFLSSTEDIWTGDSGSSQKMQAPSYDGVYYGESSCDEWFIFDYSTNALVKFRGLKFYTADQPLKIEAEAIKVG